MIISKQKQHFQTVQGAVGFNLFHTHMSSHGLLSLFSRLNLTPLHQSSAVLTELASNFDITTTPKYKKRKIRVMPVWGVLPSYTHVTEIAATAHRQNKNTHTLPLAFFGAEVKWPSAICPFVRAHQTGQIGLMKSGFINRAAANFVLSD